MTDLTDERLAELIEHWLAENEQASKTNEGGWPDSENMDTETALRELQSRRRAMSAVDAGTAVIVPREPTPEILEAASKVFRDGDGTIVSAYRAMLAARESGEEKVDGQAADDHA